MMVTLPTQEAQPELDDEAQTSIGLAIAQWMRSARATSTARERLRTHGVPETEIERRRRCDSADSGLAETLRLAVTLLIARGRLEARDLRRHGPAPSAARLRAIVAATARAFYDVSVAESIDRAPYVAIDLEIGDY